jgi:hypothetical protein
MAKDVSNNIGQTLLHISNESKSYLIQVRHWDNLKVATDGNCTWVKGFTEAQLLSPALTCIPFATFYSVKENMLFQQGRLLPERRMPALLWTPVDKALPIASPDLNHNSFGIHQRISVKLVESAEERPATAMVVDIEALKQYVPQASAIRLSPLQWCRVGAQKAFVYGIPLLPIEGASYWNRNQLFLPGGFDFELPVLTNVVNKKLNPGSNTFIVFDADGSYMSIAMHSMKTLSIGSFRLSLHNTMP